MPDNFESLTSAELGELMDDATRKLIGLATFLRCAEAECARRGLTYHVPTDPEPMIRAN